MSFVPIAPIARLSIVASATAPPSTPLYEASKRADAAQYLLDLHDSEATFDFCGGMLFQIVLTDAFRSYLQTTTQQITVQSANTMRMFKIADYSQSNFVDNESYFHGREIRKVPWAKGGRG